MDVNIVYCNKCKDETEHETVEMKEGENCWLVLIVKCCKCGSEQEIHLYC